MAGNSEGRLWRHPHSARTNLNVGAGSTATPRAFRTCLSVSVLPSIRKRLRYLVFKWLWTTSVLRRIAPSIAGRAGRLAELSQGQRHRFFPPTLRFQNQFYNFARSTLSSSARLATAGERRPVMKPVWMPIVFASERPCPSFALKIFHLRHAPGADASAAVPEITDAAIREVPSTSMRKSDFSGAGENIGRSEIGERDVRHELMLARRGELIHVPLVRCAGRACGLFPENVSCFSDHEANISMH